MAKRKPQQFYTKHIEALTGQLLVAWDTIGAVLAGRVRMQNITIQPGDILLIEDTHPALDGTPSAIANAAKRLAGVLRETGKACIVAVVPPGFKLEALDPELLEEHGWQRKPAPTGEQPQPLA